MALLMGLIISSKVNAQDSTNTLLHIPKITQIGFYIAPEYQYGQLRNGFTSFAGVSGMVIFNKSFAIGASMQRSIYLDYSPSAVKPLNLRGSFGGLKMEYTVNPGSAVHLSFPLLIGGGMAEADSASYFNSAIASDPMDMDGKFRHRRNDFRRNRGYHNEYFIIQPGVQVEANLVKCVKLFAGANYRFSIPTYSTGNSSLLPASTLQGLSLNVGVKVGLFDINLKKKK